MKALTIRNVDSRLARALQRETKRRNASTNQTVIELLRQSLGIAAEAPTNGLEKLAGTWTDGECEEFEQRLSVLDDVDPELWK